MGEAEWVQASASLMREMGRERCLSQLLDVLGDKAGANTPTVSSPLGTAVAIRRNIDEKSGHFRTS